MSLMPPAVTAGSMPSSVPVAFSWMPKAVGMEGPVMSASRMATLRPLRAMATAREAVTVLLPTPPLPLTTAMTRVMEDLALAGTRMSREEQSALQLEQLWVQLSDMKQASPLFIPGKTGIFLPNYECSGFSPLRQGLSLRGGQIQRTRVFSVGMSSRPS